jgi:hypothetical protein
MRDVLAFVSCLLVAATASAGAQASRKPQADAATEIAAIGRVAADSPSDT